MRRGGRAAAWLASAALVAGCNRAEPAKRYELEGQILAVRPGEQQLTIKHGDIPNFMMAMTMSYPVAAPGLMEGRTPGETIKATIEVSDAGGRLIAITHTGSAPLPTNTNEVGLVEGILSEGDTVPDAAFVDQTDHRRSFSEWKGTLTAVTFVYTQCPMPNYCPLLERNFAEVQRAVAADPALKGQVKLVSISFDPDRDTPAVLTKEAAKYGADPAVWTFLTGDRVTLDRFAARFGVSLIREDGSTEIAHTLRTAIVGKDGRILKFYPDSDWAPATIVADLRAAATTP